jgi:HK97 family phage major capsid protein
MTLEQLRRLYAEKINQAKALNALAKDGVFTKEQADQVSALMNEADQIMEQIKLLERVGAGESYLAEPAGTKAAHLGQGVQVVKAEEDRPFNNLGEMLGAVRTFYGSNGRKMDPRLVKLEVHEEKASGMSEAVGADGGFLLQPNFANILLKPAHEVGPFSSRINWLPTSGAASGRLNGVDETSRATGSRWGGIRGYRDGEGVSATGSAPKFRPIDWRLKKYRVFAYATDELLADQSLLNAVLSQGAGEEIDFMLNDDILNGNGVGGPAGILNSGSLVSVSKESGQAAATVVLENINKMWARLSGRSKASAYWFINQDVSSQLDVLAYTVGVAGVPAYMPPGGVADSPYGRLKGRPVIETEFNPTLGTVGDIVVADMSWYMGWEKGPVETYSSIHVQFLTDETAFKFIYRVDGQPALASALTPYKGTATTSPFVALATRA